MGPYMDTYGQYQNGLPDLSYQGPGLDGSARNSALSNAYGVNSSTTPEIKVPEVKTPGADSAGGMGSFIGNNLGTIVKGAGAVASYFQGERALDQADEQFEFQKDSWEKRFAMMQDQYYRKLNNRRANSNLRVGMSADERQGLQEHYDSGSNLEGAYTPNGQTTQQQMGSPSVANANMMNKATGGAPYSPAAAQSMMGASQSAFNNNPSMRANQYAQPAPTQAPINPSVQPSNGAVSQVVRRKKPRPATQSGNPAGSSQTKPPVN